MSLEQDERAAGGSEEGEIRGRGRKEGKWKYISCDKILITQHVKEQTRAKLKESESSTAR